MHCLSTQRSCPKDTIKSIACWNTHSNSIIISLRVDSVNSDWTLGLGSSLPTSTATSLGWTTRAVVDWTDGWIQGYPIKMSSTCFEGWIQQNAGWINFRKHHRGATGDWFARFVHVGAEKRRIALGYVVKAWLWASGRARDSSLFFDQSWAVEWT